MTDIYKYQLLTCIMKRFITNLTLLFLFSFFLNGQQSYYKKEKDTKIFIGFSSGLTLSKFIKGFDVDYPHGKGIDVTYENNFNPGLHSGCMLNLQSSNSFSFQIELNYNREKHNMVYLDWSNIGPSSVGRYADYTLYYSSLQLCFLPTYSFGRRTKVNLIGGPYFNIPVSSSESGQIEVRSLNILTQTGSTYLIDDDFFEMKVEGGVGLLYGIRIDIPINKNFVSTEIKKGQSLYNITQDPHLKGTFYLVSLKYYIRIK